MILIPALVAATNAVALIVKLEGASPGDLFVPTRIVAIEGMFLVEVSSSSGETWVATSDDGGDAALAEAVDLAELAGDNVIAGG
ncbi:MAG TPA: hypothetical protein VMX12_03565 [Acidimicrobiia bacterium]|nr:hypothetical protein [Acidimicrobiia bacterium]